MKTEKENIWEAAYTELCGWVPMNCKDTAQKIAEKASIKCKEVTEDKIGVVIGKNVHRKKNELHIFPGFGPKAQLMIDIHDAQGAGKNIQLIRNHSAGDEDPTRGGLRPDTFTLEADE